ncbi:MAG: class II fructose-bisphosphate aldolase, partial [Candidatus Omnitrophica bacterium]|nr:class II fructose-bisphosphate aldolase [Candidatus Omnitrophota bacterium]
VSDFSCRAVRRLALRSGIEGPSRSARRAGTRQNGHGSRHRTELQQLQPVCVEDYEIKRERVYAQKGTLLYEIRIWATNAAKAASPQKLKDLEEAGEDSAVLIGSLDRMRASAASKLSQLRQLVDASDCLSPDEKELILFEAEMEFKDIEKIIKDTRFWASFRRDISRKRIFFRDQILVSCALIALFNVLASISSLYIFISKLIIAGLNTGDLTVLLSLIGAFFIIDALGSSCNSITSGLMGIARGVVICIGKTSSIFKVRIISNVVAVILSIPICGIAFFAAGIIAFGMFLLCAKLSFSLLLLALLVSWLGLMSCVLFIWECLNYLGVIREKAPLSKRVPFDITARKFRFEKQCDVWFREKIKRLRNRGSNDGINGENGKRGKRPNSKSRKISSYQTIKFAKRMKKTDAQIAKILAHRAKALKVLERYLAKARRSRAPPDREPAIISWYDPKKNEIGFAAEFDNNGDLDDFHVWSVLKKSRFKDNEIIDTLGFIRQHERLHQEHPELEEEEVLGRQVELIKLLKKAKKEGYCIPAFVVLFNEIGLEGCKEIIRSLIKTANLEGSAVVIMCSEERLKLYDLEPKKFKELVDEIIEECEPQVPVFIGHDHGQQKENNFELIGQAIKAGFDYVTINDCADRKIIKLWVDIAHSRGVLVEGIFEENGPASDPKKAAEFAKECKVDCLGISVGCLHNAQVDSLDFKPARHRILRIIALTIHAGSSIPMTLLDIVRQYFAKCNIGRAIEEAAKASLEDINAGVSNIASVYFKALMPSSKSQRSSLIAHPFINGLSFLNLPIRLFLLPAIISENLGHRLYGLPFGFRGIIGNFAVLAVSVLALLFSQVFLSPYSAFFGLFNWLILSNIIGFGISTLIGVFFERGELGAAISKPSAERDEQLQAIVNSPKPIKPIFGQLKQKQLKNKYNDIKTARILLPTLVISAVILWQFIRTHNFIPTLYSLAHDLSGYQIIPDKESFAPYSALAWLAAGTLAFLFILKELYKGWIIYRQRPLPKCGILELDDKDEKEAVKEYALAENGISSENLTYLELKPENISAFEDMPITDQLLKKRLVDELLVKPIVLHQDRWFIVFKDNVGIEERRVFGLIRLCQVKDQLHLDYFRDEHNPQLCLPNDFIQDEVEPAPKFVVIGNNDVPYSELSSLFPLHKEVRKFNCPPDACPGQDPSKHRYLSLVYEGFASGRSVQFRAMACYKILYLGIVNGWVQTLCDTLFRGALLKIIMDYAQDKCKILADYSFWTQFLAIILTGIFTTVVGNWITGFIKTRHDQRKPKDRSRVSPYSRTKSNIKVGEKLVRSFYALGLGRLVLHGLSIVLIYPVLFISEPGPMISKCVLALMLVQYIVMLIWSPYINMAWGEIASNLLSFRKSAINAGFATDVTKMNSYGSVFLQILSFAGLCFGYGIYNLGLSHETYFTLGIACVLTMVASGFMLPIYGKEYDRFIRINTGMDIRVHNSKGDLEIVGTGIVISFDRQEKEGYEPPRIKRLLITAMKLGRKYRTIPCVEEFSRIDIGYQVRPFIRVRNHRWWSPLRMMPQKASVRFRDQQAGPDIIFGAYSGYIQEGKDFVVLEQADGWHVVINPDDSDKLAAKLKKAASDPEPVDSSMLGIAGLFGVLPYSDPSAGNSLTAYFILAIIVWMLIKNYSSMITGLFSFGLGMVEPVPSAQKAVRFDSKQLAGLEQAILRNINLVPLNTNYMFGTTSGWVYVKATDAPINRQLSSIQVQEINRRALQLRDRYSYVSISADILEQYEGIFTSVLEKTGNGGNVLDARHKAIIADRAAELHYNRMDLCLTLMGELVDEVDTKTRAEGLDERGAVFCQSIIDAVGADNILGRVASVYKGMFERNQIASCDAACNAIIRLRGYENILYEDLACENIANSIQGTSVVNAGLARGYLRAPVETVVSLEALSEDVDDHASRIICGLFEAKTRAKMQDSAVQLCHPDKPLLDNKVRSAEATMDIMDYFLPKSTLKKKKNFADAIISQSPGVIGWVSIDEQAARITFPRRYAQADWAFFDLDELSGQEITQTSQLFVLQYERYGDLPTAEILANYLELCREAGNKADCPVPIGIMQAVWDLLKEGELRLCSFVPNPEVDPNEFESKVIYLQRVAEKQPIVFPKYDIMYQVNDPDNKKRDSFGRQIEAQYVQRFQQFLNDFFGSRNDMVNKGTELFRIAANRYLKEQGWASLTTVETGIFDQA